MNIITQSTLLLEIACDSIRSVAAAANGGANRIELCANLLEGGTTPSFGMITLARKATRLPIYVMIRPRGGDFLYSAEERDIMINDIRLCKEIKVDGIVVGALRKDGSIDVEMIREMVEIAQPLGVTFHRAFDLTPDPLQALEDVILCKCDRLLTSGQSSSAESGSALITELERAAAGRIKIMAGAGVRSSNVVSILKQTGISEVHMSARVRTEGEMEFRRSDVPMGSPGLSNYELNEVSEEQVRIVRQLLNSL